VAGLEQSDRVELVAQVRRHDPLELLAEVGAQVVVDVTTPDAVMGNLQFAIEHGMHAVVGTTGFTEERLETLREWVGTRPEVGVVIAPNFSIGALMMMKLSAIAAPYFESVEVIELHHPTKADAPSGTARHTAELMAATRREAGVGPIPDATTHSLDGARGAEVDGIRVHSLRIRGLVAHQEVVLGGPGETLTIRHDSLDRASFVPGVLAGIDGVQRHPGLTIGLESYLGL
jgi:4-hydroxy-tetrahydrodipicolinate reductase